MRSVPLAVLLLALGASPLFPGEYHRNNPNSCADCHSSHGTTITSGDADGNATLLKTAANELCLSCHDGSRLSMGAPDVVRVVGYVDDPAGGLFEEGNGIESQLGHELEATEKVPRGAPVGTQPIRLACITCHDPHGNDNYRHLRPNPIASLQPDVSVRAKQLVSGPDRDPAEIYVATNLVDKSGISAWCNSCHADAAEAPCPVTLHPVERVIATSPKTDPLRWANVPRAERVRFGSPVDDLAGSGDDRVICLSCHKGHGSPNANALVHEDMSASGPVCTQCHATP